MVDGKHLRLLPSVDEPPVIFRTRAACERYRSKIDPTQAWTIPTASPCDCEGLSPSDVPPGDAVLLFSKIWLDASIMKGEQGTELYNAGPSTAVSCLYKILSGNGFERVQPTLDAHHCAANFLPEIDKNGGELILVLHGFSPDWSSVTDYVCWGNAQPAAMAIHSGFWSGPCIPVSLSESLIRRKPRMRGRSAASYEAIPPDACLN